MRTKSCTFDKSFVPDEIAINNLRHYFNMHQLSGAYYQCFAKTNLEKSIRLYIYLHSQKKIKQDII